MTAEQSLQEMSDRFDVYYNNITSNSAPGLNEYEKSVFLTKAQEELIKNYFNPKGNKYNEGFDGNRKRQSDFLSLIREFSTSTVTPNTNGFYPGSYTCSAIQLQDALAIINEILIIKSSGGTEVSPFRVVVPISYEEYNRLMQKPYKYPPKGQAWRLFKSADTSVPSQYTSQCEFVIDYSIHGSGYTITYNARYIKRPSPIILQNLPSGLSIHGETSATPCELPESLHEEILQRAVELAKIAWTNTGQDNLQAVIESGKRSE